MHTRLCSARSPIYSKAQRGIRHHPQSGRIFPLTLTGFKQKQNTKQKFLTDELTGQPTLDHSFVKLPSQVILYCGNR